MKLDSCLKKYFSGVKKRYYIIDFTVVFLILMLIVYSWYFFSGTTFIWWADGKDQHFRAMVYCARYIRSILKDLITERTLRIPQWDFCIGEGSDIFSVTGLYGLADPFHFLAFLFPTRFLSYYYDFMVILRIYLSGLSFIAMCLYFGRFRRWAVLSGAVTYIFSYYFMYNSLTHPTFLVPTICLPLMIIGVEKIFNRQSPLLLVFSVAILAFCGFYLLYLSAVELIIYVVVRILYKYRKENKVWLRALLSIAIHSVLGVLCAAVIILPHLYILFMSDRTGYAYKTDLFYPEAYYTSLPAMLTTNVVYESLQLGFAAPAIIAAFLLLKRKHGGEKKTLMIICIILLAFPVFGRIMNGMGYAANRWDFCIPLLIAFTLTCTWEQLVNIEAKEVLFLMKCISIWAILCMLFDKSREAQAFLSMAEAVIFVTLVFLANRPELKYKEYVKDIIVFGTVVISVIILSIWNNAQFGLRKTVNWNLNRKEAFESTYLDETYAIKNIAESEGVNEFYRYSGGDNLTRNANSLGGISSTQYYWSNANHYMSEFRTELNEIENGSFCYYGYDERTPLLDLSSVRYYVAKDSNVPHNFEYLGNYDLSRDEADEYQDKLAKMQGYDLTDWQKIRINIPLSEGKNFEIYENKNTLPFTYVYEKTMGKKQWDSYSAVEKQDAMMQAVYLQDENGKNEDDIADIRPDVTNMDFSVVTENQDVNCYDDRFVVTGGNAKVKFELDSAAEGELYITINGLKMKATSDYELYFGDETVDPQNAYNKILWKLIPLSDRKDIVRKRLRWKQPEGVTLTFGYSDSRPSKELILMTPENNYFFGKENFTVNLGAAEEGNKTVTINFPRPGIYYFDEIRIEDYHYDDYDGKLDALRENHMYNENIDHDIVSGQIDMDEPGVLCFSIPYDKGWTAYVDNSRQDLINANVRHMALKLPEGHHEIILRYHTPWLKESFIISIVFILFSIVYYYIYSGKHKKTEEKTQ